MSGFGVSRNKPYELLDDVEDIVFENDFEKGKF
jgi:hypothetical protein